MQMTPNQAPTPAILDRKLHALQSRFTGGGSPTALALAFADWSAHAANAPFQTAAALRDGAEQWRRLASVVAGGPDAIAAEAGDGRFDGAAWTLPPFRAMAQATLLGEAWWARLVATPPGVTSANRRLVAAAIAQALQQIAPSNFALTNPEVIAETRATGGANLVAGLRNFARDVGDAPESGPGAYVVGRDLAATPGEVVFRNALIELIRYAPTTDVVDAEPVLIVPAWIMKFYILDLSPGNSLVRWLVAQGRTVFMISWRNPDAAMRDTSFDDYRTLGVMAALDAVSVICGPARIHGVGYCLGGTLLAIAAAAMARSGDDRLASLSLLAAQTDFADPGPLGLFITEDQLTFLEDVMQAQGYLDKAQMEAVFQALGADKLVWAHGVQAYLMGEVDAPFDLMAWNADGTRLPARMHGEYLRKLYLHNDLAAGRLEADGRPLQLGDVKPPMFVVGTEHDGVAPWRSVFKLHHLNDGALTFVLTSGGHNAGIVSEPGHPRRHFRMRTREAEARTLGDAEWEAETPPQNGSWWPAWGAWLTEHSTGGTIAPPPMGDGALGAAPGQYVMQR